MGYLKSFSKSKKAKPKKEKISPKAKFDGFNSLIETVQLQIKDFVKLVEDMQAEYKTTAFPILLNSIVFFKVTLVDILVIIDQYHKTELEREKNIVVRNLAVHIYEFLDDTKDFLGAKMREALKGFPNEDILVKDLYKVKEYHKAIKNHIIKPLSDVRNNTAAHKEHNSLILLKKIREIDNHTILSYSIFSLVLLTMIVQFQNNIINSVNDFKNKDNPEHTPVAFKSAESVMRAFILIIHGVHPEMAEVLSTMTLEEITQVKNIIEQLNDNYNSLNKIIYP